MLRVSRQVPTCCRTLKINTLHWKHQHQLHLLHLPGDNIMMKMHEGKGGSAWGDFGCCLFYCVVYVLLCFWTQWLLNIGCSFMGFTVALSYLGLPVSTSAIGITTLLGVSALHLRSKIAGRRTQDQDKTYKTRWCSRCWFFRCWPVLSHIFWMIPGCIESYTTTSSLRIRSWLSCQLYLVIWCRSEHNWSYCHLEHISATFQIWRIAAFRSQSPWY